MERFHARLADYGCYGHAAVSRAVVAGASGGVRARRFGVYQRDRGDGHQARGLQQRAAAVLHHDGPGTEVGYRLAWARTYLKEWAC